MRIVTTAHRQRANATLSGAAIRQGKPGACGIAIMAEASAPGRTKTRLVPPLTFDQAASLNTSFLQDIAGNLLTAGRHASIAGYAAYAPPGSEAFFHRTLPPEIGLIAACLPNFGDCLLHAIEAIFARGHACAVVLNSDRPTLPTALLIETAAALAQPGERAVLGPSTDGGYYLLGLKATPRSPLLLPTRAREALMMAGAGGATRAIGARQQSGFNNCGEGASFTFMSHHSRARGADDGGRWRRDAS